MCPYQRSSEPSWREPSVKECIMHSLTIRQKHDAQEAILHLRHSHPPPNSAVGLNGFPNRRPNGLRDPLLADDNPIGTTTHCLKVARDFHAANVADFGLVGLWAPIVSFGECARGKCDQNCFALEATNHRHPSTARCL